MKLTGTKDPSVFVLRWIRDSAGVLRGRVVVDVPAGCGKTARALAEAGATVEPLDLFPQFFQVPGLTCRRADLAETLPLGDEVADWVVCQEGIEHVPDQLRALREFGRILRPGGSLLLTTPNYSSLRSRLSYYLAEAERYYSYMPPNEIDSVWRSPESGLDLYLGHLFLVGIQRLRVLGRLAGLRIRKVHHLRANRTSLFLLVATYPAIVIANLLAYWKALRKTKGEDRARRRAVYREQLRLALDPRLLVDCLLFVEFEKHESLADAVAGVRVVSG